MSIGKSLELEDMLQNALSTYLRKLNCTAGIIFKKQKLPTNDYKNEIIFSLPFTLDVLKKYPELSEVIPVLLSKSQNEEKTKSLPEIHETESKFILHIMRLGEFGYLALVKSKERINEDILNQLGEINEKLGHACISCLNNESLKESEKKYRDLSELLPGMVCETDINGYVTFVNKYAFKKLKYDNSDLDKGFHISRIFAPEDQERAKRNFAQSLIDKNMPHREYDIVKKNGEKFQALLYSNQLISGGEVKGIRGVMIDITQRKKNEDKLKQYAERLELALIASDAGLWDWNIATGKLVLNDKWYETRKLQTKKNQKI